MTDENPDETEIALETEALDLDEDTERSLEDAVRDALAAVEGGDEAREPTGEHADGEEFREKWLRALADLDNYRKRVDRERAEERKYRSVDVLREVLAIADNLQRALSAGGGVEDLKRGVEMIGRQLEGLLRDFGVRRVPAVGEPFDPAVHEAVSRHEDPEVETPTVSEELQPGYTIHDRLLRPAMVAVAMPGRRDEEGGS